MGQVVDVTEQERLNEAREAQLPLRERRKAMYARRGPGGPGRPDLDPGPGRGRPGPGR